MSASREKKKRQELASGGGVDPKAARAAEERAAERRTTTLYVILAVVFVAVAAGLLLYNSGIIQRSRRAVTIDGDDYNVAQVSYYYGDAYQSFLSVYGSYASLYGLDTSQPLDQQVTTDDEGNEITWADSFKEQAVENMRYIYGCVKAAKAEGMELESEDLASFDEQVASIKSAAGQYGYTYGSYIAAVYGSNVTTGVFESCLKDQLLADKYAQAYSDSLTYSDDELQAYYEENRNTYDLVDGGYVSVSGAPETQTDEDGNTVEATDEEKAAAMAEAEAQADAILAAYRESGDLEAAAEEAELTATVDSDLTYSSGTARSWLFDEARQDGDSDVLVDEDASACYVVVFNSRRRNEALNYNVRHVLITADSLDLDDDEEATEEQLTAKAQEILDTWDGTEEGFAALAEEWSQDPGSKDNGGLYEDVASGQMVTPFNDWCYEEGRKSGDTGVVYYSGTGAHIMYFVGYGDEPYWRYACDSALRSSAVSDWQDEMTESVTAEVDETGMASVG